MESIGQQFKAARERKGVTASQAAAATRMKVQHVEALERDDYSRLTVPTYAKGFIRLYAEYLGLDAAPLLRDYNAILSGPEAAKPVAPAAAAPEGSVFKSPRRPLPVSAPRLTLPPELLTWALRGGALIVVLLLVIWATKHGCHRTPHAATEATPPATVQQVVTPPPTPPPARTETAQPIVAPAKREPQASPWVIVNEPPPPYLKRSTTSTP